MGKKKFFVLILIFSLANFYGQNAKKETSIGFHYGFGNEIKNSNYTYTNNYYKVQVSYLIKETNHFKYELVLQPELNFATHQLLNFYFVTPEETNYIEKREKYTKLKDIKEYALGIGLCVRKPISKIGKKMFPKFPKKLRPDFSANFQIFSKFPASQSREPQIPQQSFSK